MGLNKKRRPLPDWSSRHIYIAHLIAIRDSELHGIIWQLLGAKTLIKQSSFPSPAPFAAYR